VARSDGSPDRAPRRPPDRDEPMDLESLRLAVYRDLAAHGRPPDTSELASLLGTDPSRVVEGLRALADGRLLVLDADDRVVLAHPFSSIPLGFSVMGARTLWWGGCAWDSFAIPHLVPGEPEVLVATTCPACAAPLAWTVGRDRPPAGDEVAHFLVPAARMWDDVVLTCGNQRLFCSAGCVDAWLARSGNERGYAMDLATLWRLAAGWYAGRLDRGYVRREPSEAVAYFRTVGLSGPFWGVEG
jgi:hypothetical protein